ncbi:MAG: BTAD domain-containing putative transcriptional regulator [Capsulimonadales bacterium]|nr:BTAD domain-containing putative transcriptional regulator [Capsulimonadales bacterium]
MTEGSTLSVILFGSPFLLVGGASVRPLRTRQGYTLFAFLALRSGKAVDREFIAATLWPESDPDHARSGLRRSLTDLREALGEAAGCIVAPTAHTLMLNLPSQAVDVPHFDSLLAGASPDSGRLRKAVDLYGGPLLEGFHEDWVQTERTRREAAVCSALDLLARESRDTGNLPLAIAYLRQGLWIDPSNEAFQRALMLAYYESGNAAAMVRVYLQFRLFLRRSLATVPSTETIDLFRRLRNGESLSAASPGYNREYVVPPNRRH